MINTITINDPIVMIIKLTEYVDVVSLFPTESNLSSTSCSKKGKSTQLCYVCPFVTVRNLYCKKDLHSDYVINFL